MAGDDADFAAYLAARWPSVVRTLILLGGPPAQAEDVARDALARCYGSWEHVRREDDVDAYVYRTVLERWRHGRRHRASVPPTVPTTEAATVPATEAEGEETGPVRLRRALEAELDRLAEEPREAVVLRFVAGLDDVQVAGALDVPLDAARQRLTQALAEVDLDALRELDP